MFSNNAALYRKIAFSRTAGMKALLAPLIDLFWSYVIYGLHGGIGAGANYLFHHSNKGKPFNLKGLIMFVLLGAVTVIMIGPSIPTDFPGRDGMLIAIGFMFSPILNLLDSKGGAISEWFMGRLK